MPGLTDTCGSCRKEFPFGLPRCSFCHRPVCVDCSVRMSGSIFCGRVCSHAFFYGSEEDVEETEAEKIDDDE